MLPSTSISKLELHASRDSLKRWPYDVGFRALIRATQCPYRHELSYVHTAYTPFRSLLYSFHIQVNIYINSGTIVL